MSRTLGILWCALAVLAVVQSARLSVFMLDPSRTSMSALPMDPLFVHHSCFTAYFESALLVRDVPNVYDSTLYPDTLGPFDVDLFLYPPPFLVLPRAALAISHDFFTLRALWFALDAALFASAMLLLARWIGGRHGRVAALLIPLVWVALPTTLTLQIGNFQLAAYALAVLAMIAFDRGRHALGGLLLAVVTLSKLFPGLLLVYLAARRKWRSVAWTVAMMIAWTAVAFAVLGRAPFDAFLRYHLPRIASGEAFPMLWQFPPAVAVSHSIYCIVLKLGLLGVPHMGRATANAVVWGYSAVLAVLAWLLGRRPPGRDRLGEATAWVILLLLGALRSPFLPEEYAQVAPLWLLTLVAARVEPRPKAVLAIAAAWIALQIIVPADAPVGVRTILAITWIPQVVALALVGWALRDAWFGRFGPPYCPKRPSSFRSRDRYPSSRKEGTA